MSRWPIGVVTPGGTGPVMKSDLFSPGIVVDYDKLDLHPAQESVMMVPQSRNDENTTMKWSTNQGNIFDWVKAAAAEPSKPAALVVEAVAGSGKTTTISEASRYIPVGDPSVFLAFNKAIATELGKRLPSNIESRTLNSLGHRSVLSKFGQVVIDTSKTRKIVRELESECGLDGEDYIAKYFTGDICNLVAKAKAHGLVPYESMNGELADYGSMLELKDFYNIYSECPDDVLIDFAIAALKVTVEQTNIIDFDDQLYFTVAFDIPVPQYAWIIVDEAQDLSHVNREMLKKFLAANGKIVAVGDSRQAIYGFRGADSSSLDRIAEEFSADRLPLDTTYRCPRKIVERAQQYVPEINCPDDAPDGTVEELEKFGLEEFIDTDLIVCRNTAPLISTAYRMIRNKMPVRVMGRDIGKGLVSLIKKLAKYNFKTITMGEFEKVLAKWMSKQIDVAKRRDQEDRIEAIQDKAESIFAIINGADVDTLEELCYIIDDLFQGDRGPIFSTVHRAKGLEAPRVFILDPGLMPSKFAQKGWQIKQENNLIYVAITRSLDTLCYIESKRLG